LCVSTVLIVRTSTTLKYVHFIFLCDILWYCNYYLMMASTHGQNMS
jgi:hypothetical protein